MSTGFLRGRGGKGMRAYVYLRPSGLRGIVKKGDTVYAFKEEVDEPLGKAKRVWIVTASPRHEDRRGGVIAASSLRLKVKR